MLDQIKNLRNHPHAVVWILVVLFLCVLLVQFIQLLQTVSSQSPQAGAALRNAALTDYDASIILQRQLFGAGTTDSPAASTASQTPVTNLALTLQAIFSAPNADNSNAIIAGPDGNAKNYRVGAQLADNATVERIDANQVVIKRDGKLETLRFPRPGTRARVAQNQNNELSKQDYSQLLSSLSSKDRKNAMAKLKGGGDMRSLLQALPPEQKLKVVRKRLEQLRQQSSSKKK